MYSLEKNKTQWQPPHRSLNDQMNLIKMILAREFSGGREVQIAIIKAIDEFSIVYYEFLWILEDQSLLTKKFVSTAADIYELFKIYTSIMKQNLKMFGIPTRKNVRCC